MISIIIPAYNSATTIVEALESVATQTLWSSLNQEEEKNFEQKDAKNAKVGVAAEVGGDRNSSILNQNHAAAPRSPSRTSRASVQNSSLLYEVIIVDDCSTDNTVEVVQNWITSHSSLPTSHVLRFTLHALPANGGPAMARNRGIEEAHGDWIAFLDADDVWLPHKLELQMRLAAEHPEVVLWCGDCIGFADRGELAREHILECGGLTPLSGGPAGRGAVCDVTLCAGTQNGASSRAEEKRCQATALQSSTAILRAITLKELALYNPIATSTVLVKREVLLAVGGFDAQFRGPEDYDLWLRVAAYGQRGEKRIEQKSQRAQSEKNCIPAGMSAGAPAKGRTEEEGGNDNASFASFATSVHNSLECIVHVAEPVSRYRQVPGSLSLDDRKFLPQVLKVLDKAYSPQGALGKRRGHAKACSYQYACAAWSAAERGHPGRAVNNLFQSIFRWPWSLGAGAKFRRARGKIGYYILRSIIGEA